MCKTFYFVQAMSYTASVCILAVISLERFVAIIYPMHSRRLHSISLLRATIIIVWTVAAVSGLPYAYAYDTMDIPSHDGSGSTLQFCVMFHSLNLRAYTCVTFSLWYALPLAMMALVYARISVVLWRSSHGPSFTSTRSSPPSAATPTLAVYHDASVATSERSAETELEPPVKCVVVAADLDDNSIDHEEHEVYTSSSPAGDGGARAKLLRRLGFHQRQSAKRERHLPSPQCLITVEPCSDDAGHSSAMELRSLTTANQARRQVSAVTAHTDQTALSARRKVIRLLIAVVVSFAVCVLPYHVRVLWQAFNQPQFVTDWHLIITPLAFVLYYLNSGLNPLLYAFLSKKFRESLSDLLCRRCRSTAQTARLTYDMGGHVTFNTRTARTASLY